MTTVTTTAARVNQSLHLLSSLTFVAVYVLPFTYPVIGAFDPQGRHRHA